MLPPAFDAAYDSVYAELLRLAQRDLGRATATLDTVALVSEAYLRMQRADSGSGVLPWHDASHVRAVACRAMRQIVCSHLRDAQRAKRGGRSALVTLDSSADERAVGFPSEALTPEEVLDLDAALAALEQASARQAAVMEMRFFGGFSVEEVAESLAVSLPTVKRDTQAALLFLRRFLHEQRHARPAPRGAPAVREPS